LAGRVKPTAGDLENYLKNNSNAFRVPEQVKAKYLYFGGEMFSSAEISPSDIRDYYSRRKDSFKGKDGNHGLEQATPMIVKELKQGRGMQQSLCRSQKAHDTIYQEENFDELRRKKQAERSDG